MRRLLLVTGALCIVALSWRTPMSADERPTLEQIIAGLEQYEKLLFENTSLQLRYARSETEDVTPSAYSGGYFRAEWSLAYRGDKWFAERRFLDPVKTENLWIPAEPETQIIKQGVLLEWKQSSHSAVVDRFDLGRNFYAGLFYTRNLSLDAPARIAKSNGADLATVRKRYSDDADLPFLPIFLRDNSAQYRVLPDREEVDGQNCWVVEWPGMDKFWVLPERGFAVPRRIYHFGPGKPIRYEFLHKDYREVKPGLWLPFTQIEDKYASITSESKDIWGRVAARNRYELLSAEFDSVPDSRFEVSLPPGTKVIDTIRKFKYAVEGKLDTDPFTAEIEKAKQIFPPTQVSPKPQSMTSRGWLVLALNVGVFVGIAAWLIRRRWSSE
jgi:hypothetical protein